MSDDILQYASRFDLDEDVSVCKRGSDSWCVVVHETTVLDADLNRHYEPMPSNRTEEFVAMTRFTRDEAFQLGWKYIDKIWRGER